MKSLLSVFIVICASFVLFCSPVYADQEYSGFQMWTVASETSSAVVSEFDLGATPYLYVQLPAAPDGLWYSEVNSDWLKGITLKGEADRVGFQTVYHIALSGYDWSDISNIGSWTINADYEFKTLGLGTVISSDSGYTAFTIKDPGTVPEPVSTILFLVGGSALAGRRFLRRK
ncbi:MAG: PEP-CTERM sorting domain-containing protein [Candidatus Omnitrophota bacterium]